MWFVLVCLWSMSCSTLHRSLHPSACYRTTCLTMSKVPTLTIHVCMAAPDASSPRAHIVHVCLGCPFGSATLRHRWDHLHTYKFDTSNCSHFSCSRANGSLHSAVVPIMLAALSVSWNQHARLVGRSASVHFELVTPSPTQSCFHPRQLHNVSKSVSKTLLH